MVKTFVVSGIEHILIGPDHILFLIGLLLLGGTLSRLALIVTSFTIGHSITLSLAALDILSPSARFIEPLIALTIVVVGADNLLVLRARKQSSAPSAALGSSAHSEADIRAWLAVAFGLIHGFGFAYVLKEFGLPQAALGWSLFAFNLGVEIGQLLIVAVVAGALTLVRRKSAHAARQIALVGSIARDSRRRLLVYRARVLDLRISRTATSDPISVDISTAARCADNTCDGSLK